MVAATTRVIWIGSQIKGCQTCGIPLKNIFIDGRTRGGSWAIMCEECHSIMGVGLGVGRGQKYQLDEETGEWVKVEG